MGRSLFKLSVLAVKNANKPNSRLADGGNLYLRISKDGVKSWSFMYATGGSRESRGRQREIGLGPAHTVTLAEAREKAASLRKMLIDGQDPMTFRLKERLEASRSITFEEAARTYIGKHKAGWKNPKHADQWQQTMDSFANPILGRYAVAHIDATLVLKCLEPIWHTKTETATRVRGRIERILDWCAVEKYRTGENPARWKGHLEHSLPAPNALKNVQHHPALPYTQIGAFVRDLRSKEGIAATMLELTILTAVRSGETRGATWGEINIEAGTWEIPAARMKMKRPHRIPLGPRALEILTKHKETAGEVKADDLVFPGPKEGKPYSDAAMLAVLKRMQRTDLTVHGFRSTFRDWAAECTGYPREVCEMALAHAIPNAVEAAYRRGDLLAKRTRLMVDWEHYCNTVIEESDNVIPMKPSTTAA